MHKTIEHKNTSLKKHLLLLLLIGCNLYAQRSYDETLLFQNDELNYKLISYGDPTISDFYVVISNDTGQVDLLIESLKECSKKRNQYYFLSTKNKAYSDKDKQLLLVDFVKYITSRRKLLDSRLHFILDHDYTDFYKNVYQKERLNKIEETLILNNSISMCVFNE